MLIDALVETLHRGYYVRCRNYDGREVLVWFHSLQGYCVEALSYNDKGDLIRQYYKTPDGLTQRHPYLLDDSNTWEVTYLPYRSGDPILR